MMKRYPIELSISSLRPFRLVIALVCLTSSSCYGYASIERRSAPTLEARIDHSDSEKLYVTLEDGPQQTVDRTDVIDISHPGKGAFAFGILLAAVGASMVTYGLVHQWCSGGTRTPAEDCGFVLEPWLWIGTGGLALLTGGAFAAAGASAYYNSVAAAPSPVIPRTHAMLDSLPRLTCSFCSR